MPESSTTRALLQRLGIQLPIVQAPMAGTSTPALAAAVSESGGLGSLAVGAIDASRAAPMIAATRALTSGPFNVNVFCHQPARPRPAVERAWLDRLGPEFERLGARPPQQLTEIYRSFVVDQQMLQLLLDVKPAVVSFHFGLPSPTAIAALLDAGITLMATATSLEEAMSVQQAGVHAVVAQGYEAGGHRGVFDPGKSDAQLGTLALVRLLVSRLSIPVIAAGAIMDGAGIAALLRLGAGAVQMGTAFIGCPESSADAAYRAALLSPAAWQTRMTRVISGRPARCLSNSFTSFGNGVLDAEVPDYPIAYDAGKALNTAAQARGQSGYAAQWAGQGAPLSRALPAAHLMSALAAELQQA